MSRKFSEGNSVPLTFIYIQPNTIVAIKKKEKDKYNAICVGAGIKKKNKANKPALGQAKIIGHVPLIIKEFKTDDINDYKPGDKLAISQFEIGELVNVSGTSKGKGYSGVIKRHGFHRGPESHGSDHHRAPGSIGGGYPQRVVKGKKMPGHLGFETVTQSKIEIVDIIPDENLLLLKGSIPGAKNSWVVIKK